MTFDLEKTIQYRQKGAKYDLGVADAMFKSKKYPYALFMGHLALEKLIKAHTKAYTSEKLKDIKGVFKWLNVKL